MLFNCRTRLGKQSGTIVGHPEFLQQVGKTASRPDQKYGGQDPDDHSRHVHRAQIPRQALEYFGEVVPLQRDAQKVFELACRDQYAGRRYKTRNDWVT